MEKSARDHRYRRAFAALAGAFGEAATVAMRLADAGRMHEAVRRLNGATDAELAGRGLTRSSEVDRIFG